MVIDTLTLSGLISNNLLSMEYEIQQHFEHQILAEMSASNTVKQQNGLKQLLENARAYLTCEGDTISMDLSFLNVPEGMEDYAEMIKSNSLMILEPRLQDMVTDVISLDDVQNKIREYVKEQVIQKIQGVLGGVS